jgi:curved DNA-binding protein
MRRSKGVMTAGEARQILGVEPGADAVALTRAWRSAVKDAHPDRGGSSERLQAVLEAHRLLVKLGDLQAMVAERRRRDPPPAPSFEPKRLTVRIEMKDAIFGARRRLDAAAGRWLEARFPPGVRPGDVLTLKAGGLDLRIAVEIAVPEGVTLRGADIWLEAPVGGRRLRRGQRLELETPRGTRAFTAPKTLEDGALVRLRGEGLPARGPDAGGDLIVRLVRSAAPGQGARDLLRRFSARWAA